MSCRAHPAGVQVGGRRCGKCVTEGADAERAAILDWLTADLGSEPLSDPLIRAIARAIKLGSHHAVPPGPISRRRS